MRIRILDRILVALAGLMMIAGSVALAAQLFFGKNVAGRMTEWLNNDSFRVYVIIAGILICALGVYCVLLLFRHQGRDGKFIMQKTESGELAISLKALESMVQKCLEQHKEVNAQTVALANQKGSLLVRIRGTVAGGVSIPLTVEAMQQQIRQYVTACSGVEVKDILVEIESSGPDATDAPFAIAAPTAIGLPKGAGETPVAPAEETPAEKAETPAAEQKATEVPAAPVTENTQTEDELSAAAAAAALLMDKVPEEEDDRPMHQRLFSTIEEPCVMPMPPMNLEETSKEEKKEDSEKTGAEEPKAEEARPEEPKAEDAGKEEIRLGEPKAEENATEGPKAEEPKAEESWAEEPKAEGIKAEEIKAEELKAEEPKTEPAKPEKTKTGWFKNKKNKAKETKAEEKKNEGAIPGGAAPVTENAPQETTDIKDETGGIAD